MERKIWFKAKPYGVGWYPATWEGWLITLLYVVLLSASFTLIDSKSYSGSDTLIGVFPYFFILTLALLFIAYLKGEHFGWRWG